MPAIAASGQISIAQGNVVITPADNTYYATVNTMVNLGAVNLAASNVDQAFDVAIGVNIQAIGFFLPTGFQLQKLDIYGTAGTRQYRSIGITKLPFYVIPWAQVVDDHLHLVVNSNGQAGTIYLVGYWTPPPNITVPGDPFANSPKNTPTTPLNVVPPYTLIAAYDTNLNTTTSNWIDDAQQFSPSSHIITLSAGLSFASTGLSAAEGEQGWIGIKGVTTGTRVTLFHFVNVQYIASGAPWNINWYDRLQLPTSINPSKLGLSANENWVLSFKSSISGFVASAALLYGVN